MTEQADPVVHPADRADPADRVKPADRAEPARPVKPAAHRSTGLPARSGRNTYRPAPVDRRPVLPISADESDIGWGDLPAGSSADDERILRELPPHHMG
ncbi:MAG TPA: hypothetical protein VIS06_13440 [Mycobacteriales bacterium]